ncbi:hypothetical protein [Plantactinospora sp. CA-290183]|uniref:hypothetical protein n=1 Tax=Plantactinospora sp. CA-290183 TaxID=3240006 RepID=UPI003D925C65
MPGSALLSVAGRQQEDGLRYASFLWPRRPGGDGEDRENLFRVVVLGCPTTPARLLAVVLLSPLPRAPLTRRELVILGFLLEGWSEQRIAVGLDLAVGAVSEITMRIVARLAAPDRHTALVRAARQGWFIPPCSGTPAGY